MKCRDVTNPLKELHAEMGGSEPFLQSSVAADLVQIEQRLSAELSVSLRVKETLFSDVSDIFKFNESGFLIVSSQTFRPNFHTLFSHDISIWFLGVLEQTHISLSAPHRIAYKISCEIHTFHPLCHRNKCFDWAEYHELVFCQI